MVSLISILGKVSNLVGSYTSSMLDITPAEPVLFSFASLEGIVDSVSLCSNIGSYTSSMLDITPAKPVLFRSLEDMVGLISILGKVSNLVGSYTSSMLDITPAEPVLFSFPSLEGIVD